MQDATATNYKFTTALLKCHVPAETAAAISCLRTSTGSATTLTLELRASALDTGSSGLRISVVVAVSSRL